MDIIFKPMMTALVAWISAQTGMPTPGHLPLVQMMPQAVVASASAGSFSSDYRGEALAVYRYGTETIWVSADLDPEDEYTWGVIVHELTHWLQDVNGRFDGCVWDLEPEAYRVQAQFMQQYDPTFEDNFYKMKGYRTC